MVGRQKLQLMPNSAKMCSLLAKKAIYFKWTNMRSAKRGASGGNSRTNPEHLNFFRNAVPLKPESFVKTGQDFDFPGIKCKLCVCVCAIILIHIGFIELCMTSFLRTTSQGKQKRIKPVKFWSRLLALFRPSRSVFIFCLCLSSRRKASRYCIIALRHSKSEKKILCMPWLVWNVWYLTTPHGALSQKKKLIEYNKMKRNEYLQSFQLHL